MVTYVGFVLRCGIKALCGVTPIGSLSPRLLSQSIWVCLFVNKSCLCVLREMERRKKKKKSEKERTDKEMCGQEEDVRAEQWKKKQGYKEQKFLFMFWQSQQLLGRTQLRWRYKLNEYMCVWMWEIHMNSTALREALTPQPESSLLQKIIFVINSGKFPEVTLIVSSCSSKAHIVCLYKFFDVCLVWFSVGGCHRGSKNHDSSNIICSRREIYRHVMVTPWIILLYYFVDGKVGLWFIWNKVGRLQNAITHTEYQSQHSYLSLCRNRHLKEDNHWKGPVWMHTVGHILSVAIMSQTHLLFADI